MTSLISRFAIDVIFAIAQTSSSMFSQSSLSTQNVKLEFDLFLNFNLILVITRMLQFVLILFTIVVVNRLVISNEILMSHQNAIRKRFVLASQCLFLLKRSIMRALSSKRSRREQISQNTIYLSNSIYFNEFLFDRHEYSLRILQFSSFNVANIVFNCSLCELKEDFSNFIYNVELSSISN